MAIPVILVEQQIWAQNILHGVSVPHRISFVDLNFGSSAMWPECSANSARFAAAKAESDRHAQHFTIVLQNLVLQHTDPPCIPIDIYPVQIPVQSTNQIF